MIPIPRLYVDVKFQNQNRLFQLKKEFLFERGMTGIVGPNGAGKSLSQEMIRYGLFGTAALRGTADDYKHLHVEVDFTVDERTYRVTRGKKVLLTENGVPVASGTSAVNQKILDFFGYGLKVFDIANACNQGKVEALSGMKPAERKKMVDQTIGLDVLDDLMDWLGKETLAIKRAIAAIEPMLVEPVKPVKPDHYRPSPALRAELAALHGLNGELVSINGWLSNPVAAPVKPEAPAFPETASVLHTHQEARQQCATKLAVLLSQRAALSTTDATPAAVADLQQQLDAWTRWKEKKRLLDRGHNECPECHHTWPLAADELAAYREVEEVPNPGFTQRELDTVKRQMADTAKAHALDLDIARLQEELLQYPDRSNDLVARRTYDHLMQSYARQMTAHECYGCEVAAKQARLVELQGIPDQINALNALLPACITYEAQQQGYETALQQYQDNLASLKQMRVRFDDYSNAKKAVAELKALVKTYLLPSLNREASKLLNEMTGGERSVVAIDDDFNILIDGQSIDTLEGSGKTVANLAIRIGLGQVLTNKKFSVFMGDEIDHSMDANRAEYTAQALRRLTRHISQIFLISHKRPETDHTFEMKRN